ncbi:hypothetical protein [Clostridium merdae]|uniref:hypothetical protein n=1 Tax=Clostridium merdae TaxID=1958780 RepID=UPI000A2707D1|nr:hypothetical protein [Clostridium merdae]
MLVLSIFSMMCIPAFAGSPAQHTSAVFDGQKVEYVQYQKGNTRYVEFKDGSEDYIVTYDLDSGELRLNSKLLLKEKPNQPNLNILSNGNSLQAAKYTWVYSYSDFTSLASEIGKATIWAGIIGAFIGVAVNKTIIAISNTLALTGVGIVYIEEAIYYQDPIIGNRPKTATNYIFYKNANYTGRVGNYDQRA